MSNRTKRDLFDNLDIGDEILVIHDVIAESYPGKTGVYAVFKLSNGKITDIPQNVVNQLIELGWLETVTESGTTPHDIVSGGTSAGNGFDVAVSYANWAELNEIYAKALNKDKMIISSVQHLPIYKFDTSADLEQFKLDFGDILTMNHGYNEVPAFNEVTTKYDEEFFKESTMMLVYVESNSGSCRFGVNSVYCDGTSFCVHIEQTNNPEICTDDMAGWFVTVAVPDSMIETCTEFDADFNNIEN